MLTFCLLKFRVINISSKYSMVLFFPLSHTSPKEPHEAGWWTLQLNLSVHMLSTYLKLPSFRSQRREHSLLRYTYQNVMVKNLKTSVLEGNYVQCNSLLHIIKLWSFSFPPHSHIKSSAFTSSSSSSSCSRSSTRIRVDHLVTDAPLFNSLQPIRW